MSWLEVETKAKIKDINSLRDKIRQIATFIKKEIKKDRYFALHTRGYPKKAFRIRESGKEYKINFKKWLKNLYSKDIVVKEEFEFKINKEHLPNFLALFQDLGFRDWINKTKVSEKYIYKKDKKASIEINNVSRLGSWLEIEYLCQKNEVEKAKKVIREILKLLDIKQSQIDNTGYTKMLYLNRRGK
jgi:predicted adenylyl cyclase CyaB